jgi:hypothetical protein
MTSVRHELPVAVQALAEECAEPGWDSAGPGRCPHSSRSGRPG